MDTPSMLSLLERLDDEIDDLEESLAPLAEPALSETASKLPLLDKAQLYVLVTYAIESLLFCKSLLLLKLVFAYGTPSLFAPERRQSARAPGLHRADEGEAVLRKTQAC